MTMKKTVPAAKAIGVVPLAMRIIKFRFVASVFIHKPFRIESIRVREFNWVAIDTIYV